MNEAALFALQYLSIGTFLGIVCGMISRWAFDDHDAEFTATIIAIFWPIALPVVIIGGVIKLTFRLLS